MQKQPPCKLSVPVKPKIPSSSGEAKKLYLVKLRFLQKSLKNLDSFGMETEQFLHRGGCHCRRVRWRVHAPRSVVAWSCNCSDCSMRGNTHFIVPSKNFELLEGSREFLTTYTFGTHTAKHTFCKFCGITSFYTPRSNPDGVAVTFKCVDPGTLCHVEIRKYDGLNWESSHSQTGIASYSISEESSTESLPPAKKM